MKLTKNEKKKNKNQVTEISQGKSFKSIIEVLKPVSLGEKSMFVS